MLIGDGRYVDNKKNGQKDNKRVEELFLALDPKNVCGEGNASSAANLLLLLLLRNYCSIKSNCYTQR